MFWLKQQLCLLSTHNMKNSIQQVNSVEAILQKDKRVDWELFISRHQEYSPAFAFLIFSSINPRTEFRDILALNFDFKFFKKVGDDYYWSSSQVKKLKNLWRDEGEKDSRYYLRQIKRAESYCDDLIKFSKGIQKKDFSNKSNKELVNLFEVYWEKLRKAASFMLVKHALNRVLEEKIKEKLNQIPETKENPAFAFDMLLYSAKDTLITQANKQLAAMAMDNKLSDKKIIDWLEQYDWIETFTWLGKLLTKEDVENKIARLKQEKAVSSRDTKGKRKILMQILPKYPTIADEVKALQYLLYFHTFELETLFAAHFWSKNLLEEVSKRVNLSFNEYPNAVYPEILNALKGQPLDKNTIFLRKNNHIALYLLDGEITILDGEAFEKARSANLPEIMKKTELKGRSAFRGKVTGKVKLVNSVKDFSKFKNGNILISTMTTVDFTPYLKKVKAIVTDEGGITCHAAIISRELKIPCVIGTKEATKIFADGDMVEIDAIKGIVKLLS
jgi:phosphohistidine swiveling domain-containing protein